MKVTAIAMAFLMFLPQNFLCGRVAGPEGDSKVKASTWPHSKLRKKKLDPFSPFLIKPHSLPSKLTNRVASPQLKRPDVPPLKPRWRVLNIFLSKTESIKPVPRSPGSELCDGLSAGAVSGREMLKNEPKTTTEKRKGGEKTAPREEARSEGSEGETRSDSRRAYDKRGTTPARRQTGPNEPAEREARGARGSMIAASEPSSADPARTGSRSGRGQTVRLRGWLRRNAGSGPQTLRTAGCRGRRRCALGACGVRGAGSATGCRGDAGSVPRVPFLRNEEICF